MKKIILTGILVSLFVLFGSIIKADILTPIDIYKIDPEEKENIKTYLELRNPDVTFEVLDTNKEYVSTTHQITDIKIDGKIYKWVTKKSKYEDIIGIDIIENAK